VFIPKVSRKYRFIAYTCPTKEFLKKVVLDFSKLVSDMDQHPNRIRCDKHTMTTSASGDSGYNMPRWRAR